MVAVALWRMLSRNVGKRRVENEKFLSFFRLFKSDPEKARKREEERKAKEARKESEKTHRYFNCPGCHKELRVAKGKGKIKITCPHCGHQFVKKT